MPLNPPEWTRRAETYDWLLLTLRSMGVLIQYRHITGTWRYCMGDKSRPASNSILSFRQPDGRGFSSLPRTQTITEKCWNSCNRPNLLAHTESQCAVKLHRAGLKLSTEPIHPHYLNEVWCREEGNINCDVFSPRDHMSCVIWILLASQTSAWADAV